MEELMKKILELNEMNYSRRKHTDEYGLYQKIGKLAVEHLGMKIAGMEEKMDPCGECRHEKSQTVYYVEGPDA